MNRVILLGATGIAFLVLIPVVGTAQSSGDQETSLADLARRQRKKEAKESRKPAKVFTNDDFPASHSSTPEAKPSSDVHSGASDAKKPVAPADVDSGPHDEAYFRGKMKRLREHLKSDQSRLARLENEKDEHEKDVPFNAVVLRKTEQNATVTEPDKTPVEKTYSNNPRWVTDPEGAKKAWEAKEQELAESIGEQKDKIADDQKAISDFVDQCRHENCQPGWIR